VLLQQVWVLDADVLLWLLPKGMQTSIFPHQVAFLLTRSGLASRSSVGVCFKRFSVFPKGFNEISPVEDMVVMDAPCRYSLVASG